MLIGEYFPEIPNSRGASGKLAALVGLTDYMDFYCTWGYYDLLKEGKTLEEAQMVLGERMARGIEEITRVLGQNRLRAGRCRCDSHRRDARRLRAARLSGSEIRGEDGSSRRCRHGRLDLLQELVRVGHPEMLDDLAAGDPVHVDRRQRDALPRGRHPVERPGVGALESADGHDLVAFRDDVVVHVPTVRERGV